MLPDPLPEVDQIARITGQLPLKITHPAKLLPIGIFHPPLHHILIALVIHLLEQEQPHHQPHWLGFRGSHCSLSVGIKNENCVLGFRFFSICAFDRVLA